MKTFVYPEPGEVWEWDSTPPQAVYIMDVVSRHSHGRMFRAISLDTGQATEVFFRRETVNGWERVA